MATENEGFDAEKMFDEGVEEAGIQEEAVESSEQDQAATQSALDNLEQAGQEDTTDTSEEKTQTDDKVSSETESESTLVKMLEKQGDSEGKPDEAKPDDRRVPLDEHVKLRKRAQAAEKALADLKKETQTRPAGENADINELLESLPDEQLVEGKDVKKLIRLTEQRLSSRLDEGLKKVTDELNKEEIVSLISKCKKSEIAFKKENTDFDEVIEDAKTLNLVNDSDFKKALQTDNPAKSYYDICKKKLTILRKHSGSGTPKDETAGDTTGKSKQEKPPKGKEPDEEQTDDEVFGEVFGEQE